MHQSSSAIVGVKFLPPLPRVTRVSSRVVRMSRLRDSLGASMSLFYFACDDVVASRAAVITRCAPLLA